MKRTAPLAALGLISLAILPPGCSDARDSALTRCASPEESVPPTTTDVPSDVQLRFGRSSARPGSTVPFEWQIPKSAARFILGDEEIVECWDGERWIEAWFAYELFNGDRARASVDLSAGFSVTDNAVEMRDGVIPVPAEASPGTYRMIATIELNPGSESYAAVRREARFVVE